MNYFINILVLLHISFVVGHHGFREYKYSTGNIADNVNYYDPTDVPRQYATGAYKYHNGRILPGMYRNGYQTPYLSHHQYGLGLGKTNYELSMYGNKHNGQNLPYGYNQNLGYENQFDAHGININPDEYTTDSMYMKSRTLLEPEDENVEDDSTKEIDEVATRTLGNIPKIFTHSSKLKNSYKAKPRNLFDSKTNISEDDGKLSRVEAETVTAPRVQTVGEDVGFAQSVGYKQSLDLVPRKGTTCNV